MTLLSEWIRCNKCLRSLEKNEGYLTSCGHVVCNRENCSISMNSNDRITCPICNQMCVFIQLNENLPGEVKEFFDEPEALILKVSNIIRFQNQQKMIFRKVVDKQKERVNELERAIDELRNENKRFTSMICNNEMKSDQISHSDIIPINCPGENKIVRGIEKGTDISNSISEKIPVPSKLFTPSITYRIKGLGERKMYPN